MSRESPFTRRQVLGVLGLGGLAAMTGTATAQSIVENDGRPFHGVALLSGPAADLPSPDSTFFDDKPLYHYLYLADNGARYFIETDDAAWTQLNTVLARYAEGELPAPEHVQGSIFWNDERSTIGFYDGNDVDYPVVGDDITTTPVTVENTTTETDVWDAGLSEGSIKTGRVYKIKLYGRFSNASTSDMVTLRVYLGGVLIASVTSTGKNAADAPWNIHTTMTILDAGPNGTVQPHTQATFNDDNADDHHTQENVDTTVPEVMQVTAQWNNAKVDNVFILDQGYMKEIA